MVPEYDKAEQEQILAEIKVWYAGRPGNIQPVVRASALERMVVTYNTTTGTINGVYTNTENASKTLCMSERTIVNYISRKTPTKGLVYCYAINLQKIRKHYDFIANATSLERVDDKAIRDMVRDQLKDIRKIYLARKNQWIKFNIYTFEIVQRYDSLFDASNISGIAQASIRTYSTNLTAVDDCVIVPYMTYIGYKEARDYKEAVDNGTYQA